MTRPPTDLLLWYVVHHLGQKTKDKTRYHHLRDFLVPKFFTEDELKEHLKRAEDFGIITRDWFQAENDKPSFYVRVGPYNEVSMGVNYRNSDMFAYCMMSVLAAKEGEG